jgi:hypothetical protein
MAQNQMPVLGRERLAPTECWNSQDPAAFISLITQKKEITRISGNPFGFIGVPNPDIIGMLSRTTKKPQPQRLSYKKR